MTKTSEILRTIKEMVRVKQTMNDTQSALIRYVLRQEHEALSHKIKVLEQGKQYKKVG